MVKGLMTLEELSKDAAAANALSAFLAIRDVQELTSVSADLLVVCGSSVLATAYVAMDALKAGNVPAVLISGGSGHSTVHLYNSIRRHPVWHPISTEEGRYEAEVLKDLLLAMGAAEHQLLPLEVESLNCGGNAHCSAELVKKLQLKPRSIIMVQDPTMQKRTHATFVRWWADVVAPEAIISYSPLQPKLRVNADGTALEFVPESVAMQPPVSTSQLSQWQQRQQLQRQATAHSAEKSVAGDCCELQHSFSELHGIWDVERYISLLLGEIPRLRDDANGYGPKGKNFIDHVDIPPGSEEAWARLAGRYSHLVRM